MFSRSFAKERNVLGFFAKECCVLCVLCIRTLRSLRSFPIFRKERKRTERSFGFHRSPKLEKRTEHSFFRTKKKVTYRTEKNGREQSA